MSDPLYPINAVVRRTGLSAHVIRVWERRYGAVTPQRTGSNRRTYTAQDIERLQLLAQLTHAGQAISYLAPLTTVQLRHLAYEATTPRAGRSQKDPEPIIAACLIAIQNLNARALESLLADAETHLGMQGLLQRVISPLAQRIGDQWHEGTLTAAHEHFASAVLRTVLGQAVRQFAGAENAPVLVIATPSGQLHEFGALIAGAMASNLGWRVIYLGASLPAAEIAGAARQHQAKAVGLSLVYPEDDPRTDADLARLRELTPPDIPLVVGGRAAPAYAATLSRIGAAQMETLSDFSAFLTQLRRPRAKPAPLA